jgi:hypothetical protein
VTRDDLPVRIDYVVCPTLDCRTAFCLILIKSILEICSKLAGQGDMVSLEHLFELHQWMHRPVGTFLFGVGVLIVQFAH